MSWGLLLSPFSQLQDVYDALTFMKINRTEVVELEADDLIASYVHINQNDCQIVVSPLDSDFFQLINDNVDVLRYGGEKTTICDYAYIKKIIITPCHLNSMVFSLSLVIGSKSAVKTAG